MANVLIVRAGDVVIIPVGPNTNRDDAEKVIAKLCGKLGDVNITLVAVNCEPTILRTEANQRRHDAAHPN